MTDPPTPPKRKSIHAQTTLDRDFVLKVRIFLRTHAGIASIKEVFDIALQVYGHIVWSSGALNNLTKTLKTKGQLLAFDVVIPSSVPVAIYPGRHKLTSTTFFAFSQEDQNQCVEKAQALVKELVEIALNQPKTKKQVKKTVQKPADPPVIHPNRNQTCKECGYMSQKYIQAQLLYFHILDTFNSHIFSAKAVRYSLSFDLYCKIFGVKAYPPVFIHAPNLRHILISSLPSSITQTFDLDYAERYSLTLLDLLADTLRLLERKENNFKVVRNVRLSVCGVTAHFDVFTDRQSLWPYFEASQLLMNLSPHSQQLYRKYFCFKQPKQDTPIVKSAIANYISQEFPYYPSAVSHFASRIGYNWYLIRPIFSNSRAFKRETETSRAPERLRAFINQRFATTTLTGSTIAESLVTPTGVITRLNIPWTKLGLNKKETETQLTRPDCRDAFAEELASCSASRLEDPVSDFLELSVSDVMSKMSIESAGLRLSSDTAELVERLKIASFADRRTFSTNDILDYIGWSSLAHLDDAIAYVRLAHYTKVAAPTLLYTYYQKAWNEYTQQTIGDNSMFGIVRSPAAFLFTLEHGYIVNVTLQSKMSIRLGKKVTKTALALDQVKGITTITNLAVPYPQLAPFDVEPFHEVFSVPPPMTYKTYPTDLGETMLTAFMQLEVICKATDMLQLVDKARVLYAVILKSFERGLTVMKHPTVLQLLMDFGYITPVAMRDPMPHFVDIQFVSQPASLWRQLDNKPNTRLINAAQSKIFETVNKSPGICIADIATVIGATLADTIRITDLMALDESIAVRDHVYVGDCSLDGSEMMVAIHTLPPFDFLQRCESSQHVVRTLYPVLNGRHAFALAGDFS